MFWNKAKRALKDKEAGLVFNWRNIHPLKYPLFAFFLLSLIAHFFFLQLFQIPEKKSSDHSLNTATLFILSETHSPETQRLLTQAAALGIATPRGAPNIDPLTKGINDQLSFRLTAGLYDWHPKARPYPMKPFDETGTADLSWDAALPPVNKVFLTESTPTPSNASSTQIQIVDLSPTLAKLLPSTLPARDYPPELAGEEVSFAVIVDRYGTLTFSTPLDKNGDVKKAFRSSEQWIRSIHWDPSTQGAEGIIKLTWEEAPHD